MALFYQYGMRKYHLFRLASETSSSFIEYVNRASFIQNILKHYCLNPVCEKQYHGQELLKCCLHFTPLCSEKIVCKPSWHRLGVHIILVFYCNISLGSWKFTRIHLNRKRTEEHPDCTTDLRFLQYHASEILTLLLSLKGVCFKDGASVSCRTLSWYGARWCGRCGSCTRNAWVQNCRRRESSFSGSELLQNSD